MRFWDDMRSGGGEREVEVEAGEVGHAAGPVEEVLVLEAGLQGAQGVLINITGGMDLAIDEVNTISTIIQEEAGDDAEIIFGAVHDPAD